MRVPSLDRYQYERGLFGGLVRHAPEHVARKYSYEVRPRMFAHAIATDAVDCTPADSLAQMERGYQLVKAGIFDTYLFFAATMKSVTNGAEYEKVTNNPETQNNFLTLALKSDEASKSAVGDSLYASNQYVYDPVRYVVLDNNPAPVREGEGCPFAGNNENLSVDPLFTRFAAWAGKLAFEHYHIVSLGQHEQPR